MKQNKGTRFKSFTDINNYNNFLLDLDKTNNTNTNTNTNTIKDLLKDIDKTYNSNNFTSINNWDRLIQKLDPNIYKNENEKEIKTPVKNNCVDCKPKQIISNKQQPVKPIEDIKQYINIQVEINNITDILTLIEKYPDDKSIKYNINMSALHKIKEPLIELNNMIGMKSLKENIVDQILFYIQNLHKTQDIKEGKSQKISNDFMHTVIYGPPGTGKTEIAKIMGQLFSKIGILDKSTFKKVTRSDLVAGYLGQTAIKTSDVIKECLGGVLFIDEAYALGNPDKRDSFSKECIDTLCEALSNHKDNLMVIIAGYESDLNECFFNYNQGLNSRFTWRFKTDDYSAEDLYKIFVKKVNDDNWSICEKETGSINIKWFEKNKGLFKFYGRDIETLFAKVKIAHSRRVFCLDENVKKKLIIKDIDKGLEMFMKNENSDVKKNDGLKKIISSMYV